MSGDNNRNCHKTFDYFKKSLCELGFIGVVAVFVFLFLVISFVYGDKDILQISSSLSIPVLFFLLIKAYSKNDYSSVKISIVWGILGFSLLIFGIYVDEKYFDTKVISIIVNISGTLISLSIIGVILQLKDTKDYFANALSELIMQESYISKLNREQLERLQKTVLEKYFENSNDFNRENSFYRFFNSHLQKYIGSPYRESYKNTISIKPIKKISHSDNDDGGYEDLIIDDSMSYQIRSMGNRLQDEIVWGATENEIKSIKSIKVWIDDFQLISWPPGGNLNDESENSSDENKSESVNEKGSEYDPEYFLLENFENPEPGVLLKIFVDKYASHKKELKAVYKDGAIVKIKASYSSTNYNSIISKMVYPTKGLSLSIFHPEEILCKVEPFGFGSDVRECSIDHANQGFTLDYPDWVLPQSGVYISIEDKLEVKNA